MKILILDGATFGEDIDISKFNELGEVIVYAESTKQQVLERLKDVNPDAVIVNKIVMGKEEMYTASNLKIILEAATGYNNIDIECANALNIRVANVAGYSTMSVVQHTFAHLFYLYEKMRYYDDYVKSGDYSNSTIFANFGNVFNELAGKTWGIVGLGNIGRRVADVAKAFGCKVVYYSASGNTYDTEYEKVELDDLLKNSDIISIHAPLNKYTENLMNYENFKKMKNTAYLINMGRGPIVNEADLAKAINEGEIAGAGLDVLEKEETITDFDYIVGLNRLDKFTLEQTIINSQLFRLDNVIVTPHTAFNSREAIHRILRTTMSNINEFSSGNIQNNVIKI